VLQRRRQRSILVRAPSTRSNTRVQAFFAQRAVQALDERVLGRLAGIDEVERHAVAVRPAMKRLARELRPVVITIVARSPRSLAIRSSTRA
jgi:hypothetical protein